MVLGGILLAIQAYMAFKARRYAPFRYEFNRALAVLFRLPVDTSILVVKTLLIALVSGVVFLALEHLWYYRRYKNYLRNVFWTEVGFISSELLCSGEPKRVDPKMTVEKAITLCMPGSMSEHSKRKRAIELLTRCHFSMYRDGQPVGSIPEYFKDKLLVGKLSGGQTHLIHILQVLSSQPRLLICDELLGGLDQRTQIAVLKLIREMQLSTGMAILYISTEMGPMQVMAHEVAFMYEGTVAIQDTPEKVFQCKDREVQQYVSASKAIFKGGDPAVHFRNSLGFGVRC